MLCHVSMNNLLNGNGSPLRGIGIVLSGETIMKPTKTFTAYYSLYIGTTALQHKVPRTWRYP